MLLNKAQYPTVNKWHVSVYQKIPNVDSYTLKLLSTKTLLAQNYTYIDEYSSGVDLQYLVVGLDVNGNVVANPNDVPVGWNGGDKTCSWQCIGSNYAYAIDFYSTQQGGSGRYIMVPPYKPIDQPCYYEWVEASYFTTWAQDPVNAPQKHDIFQNTQTIVYPYSYNPEYLIKVFVPNGSYKYDRSGYPINGWVYGVKKAYGPFYNNSGYYMSNPTTDSDEQCGYQIAYPTGQINMAIPSGTPPLSCDGTGRIMSVGNNGDFAEVADPITSGATPCTGQIYDTIGYIWKWSVYRTVSYSVPCINLSYFPTGSSNSDQGIEWPSELHQVNIVKFDGDDVAPLSFLKSDVFDQNGDFIGDPNITLTAGLYQVQYIYSDLSVGTYYFQVSTPVSSKIYDKDFLTYNAYPVPISNNKVNLAFRATKKLKFT